MDAAEWMKRFKSFHQEMREGKLSGERLRDYLDGREQLALSMVKGQGLLIPEGSTARKAFRVAQAYQLEIDGVIRTLTRDVSLGGFSALLSSSPRVDDVVRFKLTMSKSVEPLAGDARVVSSVRQTGNSRVSVQFLRLPDADLERLEMALFDAVLVRFG